MSNKSLPKISLDSTYGILSAAFVLISHFADIIFGEIDTGLRKLYGENWMKKLQNDSLLSIDFNSRDPQSILKELARNGSSQFRLPLNSRIERENLGRFYDGLDDLLGERNAWVHRQLSEDILELKDLANSADELLKMCSIRFDYQVWVSDLLTAQHIAALPVTDGQLNSPIDALPQEIGGSTEMQNDPKVQLAIGDPVTARFLTHSYVVGDRGDVIDRATGVQLSQFNSEYQRKLIAFTSNLKIGSRLRLTTEAQLCSFFEDHWGFLTDITPGDWFPNHLK
jgi:hypothetical protein